MLPERTESSRSERDIHFKNLGRAILNSKAEALTEAFRCLHVWIREGLGAGAPNTAHILLRGPSAPEADSLPDLCP